MHTYSTYSRKGKILDFLPFSLTGAMGSLDSITDLNHEYEYTLCMYVCTACMYVCVCAIYPFIAVAMELMFMRFRVLIKASPASFTIAYIHTYIHTYIMHVYIHTYTGRVKLLWTAAIHLDAQTSGWIKWLCCGWDCKTGSGGSRCERTPATAVSRDSSQTIFFKYCS